MTYKGCWENLPGQAVVSTVVIQDDDSITPSYCVDYCYNLQYYYAAVQNGLVSFIMQNIFYYWLTWI